MEPPILDTLVKLASLGASGISIFAIFWIGWLISRTPSDAGAERHRTMRLFMAMCLAIAIVAGVTGYLNVRLRSGTVDDLRAALAKSEQSVQHYKELRASARGTLDTLERVVHSKELAAAESRSTELQRDVEILKGAIEDLKGKL
jgi:hypothetical protein